MRRTDLLVRSVLAVVAALALAAAAHAVDLESFEFDDSDGTELDFAANTANPGNMWTVDFDNLVPAEVESGVFRITKDNNNTAPGVLQIDNVSSGTIYLVAQMSGWAFRGFDSAEPEQLRFGFLNDDTGELTGNVVTAQMQIARNTTTESMELVGDALGAGSSNIPQRAPLAIDQTSPFTMVLEVNKTSNTYEVFFKNGSSPSESLGMGAVSPDRNANSVRLFVNNNFGSDFTEHASIDRIAASTTNPLTDLVTLEVNRETGEMTLMNTSGAAISGLTGYSITSAAGALDTDGWRPVTGNYDSNGNGSVDDTPWDITTETASELAESVLSGDGGGLTIDQSVVLSTGGGVWIQSPSEDLQMELMLSGGVTRGVNVNFVGNGGERFVTGDLDFDGALTVDDWLFFIADSETDLSGLSRAEAYQRGDFNGDGFNNIADFATFKTAFNAANGAGAFEAMVASVPEPSSFILLAIGVMAIAAARQRARCSCVLGVFILFACAGAAKAEILEDFTFDEPNDTLLEDAQNSANPGNGWLVHANTVESAINNGSFRIQKQSADAQAGNSLEIDNITSGKAWLVAEIAGWNYTATPSSTPERIRFGFLHNDPPVAGSSTVAAEMNIDRSGSGLALFGDALGFGSTEPANNYALPLVQTNPLTIALELDKDANNYTIYYKDGVAPWASIGTGLLGDVNQSASTGAIRSGNSLRFAFTGTFGDTGEFFDVDRVYLTNETPITDPVDPVVLTLEVQSNGMVSIVNNTNSAISFDSYRITSASASLDFAGWNSLSDQGIDAVGMGTGETWDEAGGSNDGVLAESFLLGSSTLNTDESLTLGNAFRVGGTQDLAIEYRDVLTGSVFLGSVEYITGDDLPGDFNGDGVVDAADYTVWRDGLGGMFDEEDYAEWKMNFGATGASPSLPVAEPGAGILISVALGGGIAMRRRWRTGNAGAPSSRVAAAVAYASDSPTTQPARQYRARGFGRDRLALPARESRFFPSRMCRCGRLAPCA